MGNENSSSSVNKTQHVLQENGNCNSMETNAAQDSELRSMRRSLKKDQEEFILNNLMLCVRFFENYQREIEDLRSSPITRRENDVNVILSQSQKHILLPGALEERVTRNVKFTSTRLADYESSLEPIQPVRMYVVLDNVSVNEVTARPKDSTIANPIFYRVRLEPSTSHGYVKLRSLEARSTTKEQVTDSSELDLPLIAEDDDGEILDEKKDVFNSRMNPGIRVLQSQAEKRSGKMTARLVYSQSMENLDNIDAIDGDVLTSKMREGYSQTNLGLLEHPDDEGYQEASCSRSGDRRSNGLLKQSRMLKLNSRSVESIPRSSRSSGYKSGSSGMNSVTDSDSDYGYATNTSSKISKSLVGQANRPISSSEIPPSCFKKFIHTREGIMCSEKAKKLEPRDAGERRIRRMDQRQNVEQSYLRSHKFRRYFKNMFVHRLAKPLGFEIEDDTDVTRQGAIIHCYSMEVDEGNPTLVTPHEIVPCISTEWPGCCNEWLERSRRIVFHSPSKDTWLTEEMIDEVEQLGCHIIPESCMPTRNTNPYHAVEWQVNFPAAERYLETCLSHSQAHVYMTALLLHRTFIRSTDPTFGLTRSHIRSQLFSLLEENSSASLWSESRAGEGLKELLKKLYSAVSLSQPRLADYFISKRNLFANIPRQYLHLTQKQIRRIIDNPVMYLIAALKNLRYKPDFFPVLDYKRLFTLLTIDDDELVEYISPDLRKADISMVDKQQEEFDKYKERFDRIEGFLYDPGQTISASEDKSKNSARELVVEITDECAELEGLRLTTVLNMFIEHFTNMAERCYQYSMIDQKDIYLDQAYRLSMILRDQPYGKEDATRYLDTINALRKELASPEDKLDTSAHSDHSTVGVPLNQYFTDQSEKQKLTLFLPEPGESDDFDNCHIPERRRPTVNFQLQELTSLWLERRRTCAIQRGFQIFPAR